MGLLELLCMCIRVPNEQPNGDISDGRDMGRYFENATLDTPALSLKGVKGYGRVVDVYDGDTLTLVLHVFSDFRKVQVRLVGIDTCEMKSKDDHLRETAVKARDRVIQLATGARHLPVMNTRKAVQAFLASKPFVVYVECQEQDKYGRTLANIGKDKGGPWFSDILVRENLAFTYGGGTKLTEDQQRLAV